MYSKLFFRAIALALFLTIFNLSALAAPPACKKNDPGYPDCLTPPPPPSVAIVVNSATVDWPNQQITVQGEGLDSATDVSLGGSALLSTVASGDGTELSIPFDADVANAVIDKGSYQLNINSTDVLSVFIKSQIISADAIGCPCDTPWSDLLAPLNLERSPECLEITGDSPDIAGTIYTDINDLTVYPQYPIGASYRPNDPELSVCRLVQVNGDGTRSELVERINQTQQGVCATILKSNYCSVVTPIP